MEEANYHLAGRVEMLERIQNLDHDQLMLLEQNLRYQDQCWNVKEQEDSL